MIERYNGLVEKGCDEDFYKEASRLAPLDTPPFYAARIGDMLLCIQSGLTTDADLRVLDTDQQPIEGLFAIGNDCGGTYAHAYPSRVAGLNMGRNLTFARHVANYLAE